MNARNVIVRSVTLLTMLVLAMQLPLSAGQKKISYQGKLSDASDNPIDSNNQPITVTFRLYNAGGTQLWAENQGVVFNKGLFNVTLGTGQSLDSLPFTEQYYLGIQVAGDQNEMSPRQPINASGYALGSLGDFDVKNNLITRQLNVAGNSTINGNSIVAGNIGIGAINSESLLNIYKPGATNNQIYLENGNTQWRFGINNGLDSAFCYYNNTTGTVPLVLNKNGNVGIGTTNPGLKLDVLGADSTHIANFKSMTGGAGIFITPTTNDQYYLGAGLAIANDFGVRNVTRATVPLYITGGTGGGNVGIGTTNPVSKLDVLGADSTHIADFRSMTGGAGIFITPTTNDQYYLGSGLAIANDFGIKNITRATVPLYITGGTGGGNIGIGTSDPKAKLDVNGYINFGFGKLFYDSGGSVYLYNNYNGDSNKGIKIWSNGSVDVWGPVWADYHGTHSDARLKKNIENLSGNILDKVLRLQAKKYDWDKEEYKKMRKKSQGKDISANVAISSGTGSGYSLNKQAESDELSEYLNKKQIGLLAQDLEIEFPELVVTDMVGYKGIDYDKLTAVLIEAIKEQQKQINELRTLIQK